MRACVLGAAVALAGCRKPPTLENHYYSLVLEAADDHPVSARSVPAGRVDIVEVSMPDFLMSRSLVLQVNSNEVQHAKYHHWGEPLDAAVRKVLSRDLSAAHPSLDIAPGHGRGADCTLFIEFDRFHATGDARVFVSGRYTFVRGAEQVRQEFDVTRVQRGDGYTSAVKGMRQGVRALGEELGPLVARCTAPRAEAAAPTTP